MTQRLAIILLAIPACAVYTEDLLTPGATGVAGAPTSAGGGAGAGTANGGDGTGGTGGDGTGGTGGDGTGGTGGDGAGGTANGGDGAGGTGDGGGGVAPVGGAAGAPTGGGGTGGAPEPEPPEWDFATGLEGWYVDFSDPVSLMPMLSHDPATGHPEPGSMDLEIPFGASDQKAQVGVLLVPSRNLTGKIVEAQVRLDSGLATKVKIFVKSGSGSIFADGGEVNLTAGQGYRPVAISVDAPAFIDNVAEYDPTDVRAIGIEVGSGSSGAFTAHLHLDSVDIR